MRQRSRLRGGVLVLILALALACGAGPALFAQDIDMDRIEAEDEFRFGVSAFHNGRYNEAILSFSRSLSFDSENIRTRYWLGRAYYFAGFVDAAVSQWQYIVDAGESSAHLRTLLETVNARQGVTRELYRPGDWTMMSELSGVQGERALFRRPVGIEPRADGSFYVTSFATQDVLLLNANGVLEQRLRGGLAGFDQPFDVHDPGTDFLFVSEFGGDRVAKVNRRGNKMLTFGDSGTGDGGLLGPQYLTSDGRRFVYVSDWGNGRVCKFNFDGEFVQCFGQLSQPTGIVYRGGEILVADAADGRLYVFDESGNLLRTIGELGLVAPEKMFLDETGDLIVADGGRLVRIDPEDETAAEVSDVPGSSERLTAGVVDANGNLLASDFEENKLYFLSRIPSLYSGLHVQIERIVSDNFPEVYIDVAVQDRIGNPIVGLDATNFYAGEDGRPLERPELVSAAHEVSSGQVVMLLDKSPRMSNRLSELEEAAAQLTESVRTSVRVISAGESPVVEADAGASRQRVIREAGSSEGFSASWAFDRGVYFSATSLLDTREHRAVVFVTDGNLAQGAFRNYGLQELAALLRNNHIRFYTVYVSREQRDDSLEFLSEETGGQTMFLYQDDGIRNIAGHVVENPAGRYTLRVESRSNTDFGRAYIPLEIEAYLIRRSGRDESGYFGPREF